VASSLQYEQWINLNSFVARVYARGLLKTVWYGFYTLDAALEWNVEPLNKALFSCDIVAPAQWMKLSACSVLAVFRRGLIDEHDNTPSDSFLTDFRGSNKLSYRRWELWRTKFEQYASKVDLPATTRVRARRAVIAMVEAVAAELDD
jgi:hypothetical protein